MHNCALLIARLQDLSLQQLAQRRAAAAQEEEATVSRPSSPPLPVSPVQAGVTNPYS